MDYPKNLLNEVGVNVDTQSVEDFVPTLHYVLENKLGKRGAQIIIMRFRDNKTLEEIGAKFDLTRQRVNVIVADSIAELRSADAIGMLTYGIKGYMEKMLNDRIEEMTPFLAEEERETAVKEAYNRGYENGLKDAVNGESLNKADLTVVRNVKVKVLPFSVRSINCFANNNIETLGDIIDKGDKLKDMLHFGRTSFMEVMGILESYNVDVRALFPRSFLKFKL